MQPILTVTELTLSIKNHLESKFPSIVLKGEISNFKEQTSGHLYFTLKDAESQISCVLFKGNTKNLARRPKDGDQVTLKAELTVYPPRGSYQLLVKEMQYSGVGELLLKLHELKNTLQARGWLSPSLKKPLPKFPKRIGIVTSATGAVIQDIINVLSRRFHGLEIVLNPVKVQGEGAAEEIAKAIYQFNQHKLCDVLIVGRGGGSLEDLWPFNEEIVAKAIFESHIPVISAVGHETDFSISDLVADIRAPTPSAAAELVIGEKSHYLKQLELCRQRVLHTILGSIKQYKHRLDSHKKQPYFTNPSFLLSKYALLIDDAEERLREVMTRTLTQRKLQLFGLQKQAAALKPTLQIQSLKARLQQIDKSLQATFLTQLGRKKEHLARLIPHLKSIDPKNLIAKGYCILFPEKENSAILSIKDLHLNSSIRLLLNGGVAKATIGEIVHD